MNDITVRFLDVYNYLLEQKQVSSPSDFAKKIEISTSMMNEISKGRSNAGINPIQNTVIKFNEISAEWLLTGKGNRLKSKTEEKENLQEDSGILILKKENAELIELNDLLRFKVRTLENQLANIDNDQPELPFYNSAAEPETQKPSKKYKRK